MAKIEIRNHLKFKQLRRKLQIPDPYILGHLECMFSTANDMMRERVPVFKDAEEVEMIAEWIGEDGAFFQALLDVGFLDAVNGGFQIHDQEEHAPSYIKKRVQRARDKRENAAFQPKTGDNDSRTGDNGSRTADNGSLHDMTLHDMTEEKNKGDSDESPAGVIFDDSFWPLYREAASLFGRRPGNKTKALAQWKKMKALPHEVTHALQQQVTAARKFVDAGEFYPMFPDAERWLRDKRWEDEIPTLKANGKAATQHISVRPCKKCGSTAYRYLNGQWGDSCSDCEVRNAS